MRTAVLASNFYREREFWANEWVKVGWMMSIDEESVLSVQLVPSFLPFFAFFFISILSSSFLCVSLSLSFSYICFFSITHCLFLFFSLFQGTPCIHLDHINVIIIIHCIYVCEQQVRGREREKRRERTRKKSLNALHYHYNHQNIYVWIGERGGVAQVLLTVQSTRTYYTHYLMDFCILLSITLNDSKFVRENMSMMSEKKEQTWLHHQTPDSLAQTKELGVYTEKKDSIGVTSFT